MINIYDSANKLAEDLTQTDQYKALADAVKVVQEDAESAALFKKMQSQQTGQPLSEEDQQAYKDLNDQVQNNKQIVSLLQTEQSLYELLNDIQKTYSKPINDLYEDLRK